MIAFFFFFYNLNRIPYGLSPFVSSALSFSLFILIGFEPKFYNNNNNNNNGNNKIDKNTSN